MLKIANEFGAELGLVIQAGFVWKVSAAGKNVLDEEPPLWLPGEGGSSGSAAWKMFPGIAVISPGAKLPFSPGMNHADVKCLCFRNPAEFTARPSLLLTCVYKPPAFFQCPPVIPLPPAPESH